MKIDWFRLSLLGNLTAAREYLEAMTAAVPHLRDQAALKVKEQATRENWEYPDYDCAMQEVASLFEFSMPAILAQSFIVYLHSSLERSLADVAKDVRRSRKLALKHNEVAGSPIERSRLYLSKVAGVGVADLPGWGILRDIARVRDVVVHRGGQLGTNASERESLRELSLRVGGLVTASYGWDRPDSDLEFGASFCRYAVESAYTFFESLLDRTRGDPESA